MKMDKDSADEFEFKPLTEGLGFHPKKETTSSVQTPSKKAASLMQPSMKASILETPLPRPQAPKNQQPSTSGQAVESILKSLNDKNRSLKFEDKSKAISPYLQTTPSLSAGVLDMLLITSLGLIYMMSLIFTLKVDLIKVISEGGLQTWGITACLFLGVGFVYYIAQRMFLGFTVGEWAYEQRLGLPEEQKGSYSLRVLARQVLIFATGVFVLPLLSWALGRDLAGISGLCIYRKR